jgi:sterol desaturase/sphingolipid hydroxylase (fatty acid hydroxylase superfamily)
VKARTVLLTALGVTLIWYERRRALRRRREPDMRHAVRNLAVAGLSAATVQLADAPVVMRLARWIERRQWGLVNRLRLSAPMRDLLAIVLMDYTLYLWHILTHRVPWLWRLHLVHHVDLDLDTSTGLRFHFAEIAASIPWRAAQVAVVGTSPRALTAWQSLTLASILFHHSNSRLPIRVERLLCRLLMTPRLHAIHHSTRRTDTDANFSSGLAVWDILHGTRRVDIGPRTIDIGVPAYRDIDSVGLAAILALPVTHDRPTWTLPGDCEAGSARHGTGRESDRRETRNR